MTQSRLELTVGVFVLAGLAAVGWLALKIGAGSRIGGDTYLVKARFTNVAGLDPGSSVVIAGVPVGHVESVTLDLKSDNAIVAMMVRRDIELPTDSIVSVGTNGLLGDRFLAIRRGADTETVEPGGLLTETEPAIDLMALIGKVAFGNVKNEEEP
jgi:phospholipid/cholesterol/gamma-HCH transport system substrate-binding protein